MKLGVYAKAPFYFRYDGKYIYIYNAQFVFYTYFKPLTKIQSRLEFRSLCNRIYEEKLKKLL